MKNEFKCSYPSCTFHSKTEHGLDTHFLTAHKYGPSSQKINKKKGLNITSLHIPRAIGGDADKTTIDRLTKSLRGDEKEMEYEEDNIDLNIISTPNDSFDQNVCHDQDLELYKENKDLINVFMKIRRYLSEANTNDLLYCLNDQETKIKDFLDHFSTIDEICQFQREIHRKELTRKVFRKKV